jgi:hypothetical protein
MILRVDTTAHAGGGGFRWCRVALTAEPLRIERRSYFFAGIAILETVIVSPFMSPVNVTPAWPACI